MKNLSLFLSEFDVSLDFEKWVSLYTDDTPRFSSSIKRFHMELLHGRTCKEIKQIFSGRYQTEEIKNQLVSVAYKYHRDCLKVEKILSKLKKQKVNYLCEVKKDKLIIEPEDKKIKFKLKLNVKVEKKNG